MKGYKCKFNRGMHEHGSNLGGKVLSTLVTIDYSSNGPPLQYTNDIRLHDESRIVRLPGTVVRHLWRKAAKDLGRNLENLGHSEL